MKALWLLLLLPLLSLAPDTARLNCRSDIRVVTHCVVDGGHTHLLIIDLSDPYLRVQTVMANDVLDVRPPEEERESVIDLARRYRDDGVIAAINGDLLWCRSRAGRPHGGARPTAGYTRVETIDGVNVTVSEIRFLIVTATYNSTLGTGLPLSGVLEFRVLNTHSTGLLPGLSPIASVSPSSSASPSA